MSSEYFLGRFTEPIEIGQEPTALPHLEHPALLDTGGDILIVAPEFEPTVRELQEYRIIALEGVRKTLTQVDENKGHLYLEKVALIYSVPGTEALLRNFGVPSGIAIVKNNEEVVIGRITTPQLRLSNDVSRIHAIFTNTDAGISIVDAGSTHGSRFLQDKRDAERALDQIGPYELPPEFLRNVLDTWEHLLTDNGLNVTSDKLQINGDVVRSLDTDQQVLAITIKKAIDFPELHPPEDYRWISIEVNPNDGTAKAVYVPDDEEHVSGVRRATYQQQLTHAQLYQLLAIATSQAE